MQCGIMLVVGMAIRNPFSGVFSNTLRTLTGARQMPAQTGQAQSFFDSLGGELQARILRANEESKGKEIKFGRRSLPAGIKGGIARVTKVWLGVYKEGTQWAGKRFLMAQAVVLAPTHHNGFPLVGIHTQTKPEPLCNTPLQSGQQSFENQRLTIEEHWDHVTNFLGTLGLDRKSINPRNLEAYLEALTKSKPYISFETWQPDPDKDGPNKGKEKPIFELWGGKIDYKPTVVAAGATAGVRDGLPQAPETSNGQTLMRQAATTTAAKPSKGSETTAPVRQATVTPTPSPTESSPEQIPFDDQGDLDSLAIAADQGDGNAQGTLRKHANGRGWNNEEIDAAHSWSEVRDMIEQGKGSTLEMPGDSIDDQVEEQPQEEEPHEVWEPIVGATCGYKPWMKAANKFADRPVQCEIVKVHPDGSVNLKNLDNGVVYAKVKVEKLEIETA